MNWFDFAVIALKLFVVFICIVLFLKATGKSSMSQMSSIDFIGNMILGGIAGGIIYNSKISILDFLIVLIIWTAIMFISNFLTRKSQYAKAFIVGNPIVLMENGKIDLDAFKTAKLDMSGFSTLLRMNNVTTISEVNKALIEPNGHLTIIKKGDEDIGLIVVENEQVNKDALEKSGKDEAWLKRHLKKEGFGNTKKGDDNNFYQDLFCVEYYNGKLFVIPCESVKPSDDETSDNEKNN
ncbi:DUF421 domain-containing protein [Orbaceae bacterium ESL0721]|nr:DUF421 domain-containing protein [Orbaceae bacterium ESL0721]